MGLGEDSLWEVKGSGNVTAESVQMGHRSLVRYYGWQLRDLLVGV